MAHLVYGLDQGEEIILLSGQVGMGKTLALHSLLARVSAAFTCVMVSSTKLQFRELLKMVLFDLKVKIEPQADLADLFGSLQGSVVGRGFAQSQVALDY
ncbi:MAG: hypothetical protein IPO18_03780 [bacterium]|nr:hypothetical protein [bacterium]